MAPGDLVTWIQVAKPDSHFYYIYVNGTIRYEALKRRYLVSNPPTGDYTVTIKNIQPNDAGRYFCLRGNFNEKPHYVTETEHLYAAAIRLYVVYVKEGNVCMQFITVITD